MFRVSLVPLDRLALISLNNPFSFRRNKSVHDDILRPSASYNNARLWPTNARALEQQRRRTPPHGCQRLPRIVNLRSWPTTNFRRYLFFKTTVIRDAASDSVSLTEIFYSNDGDANDFASEVHKLFANVVKYRRSHVPSRSQVAAATCDGYRSRLGRFNREIPDSERSHVIFYLNGQFQNGVELIFVVTSWKNVGKLLIIAPNYYFLPLICTYWIIHVCLPTQITRCDTMDTIAFLLFANIKQRWHDHCVAVSLVGRHIIFCAFLFFLNTTLWNTIWYIYTHTIKIYSSFFENT